MHAPDYAALARIAMGHITQVYPHSGPQKLKSASDWLPPEQAHPLFCGSYDWHSCVHSHWLLVQVLNAAPQLAEAEAIRQRLLQFNSAAVAAEIATFERQGAGFERPYGWAWLLKLQAELLSSAEPSAKHAAHVLQPLAQLLRERLMAYLPRLPYPIRSGQHNNTAFALLLALDYASIAQDQLLAELLRQRSLEWFADDVACPAWGEPGGEDFLSPSLQQAVLMQRLMAPKTFAPWLAAFFPQLASEQPATLFQPVSVVERSDGKLAHLDGLNLSRAWCWFQLAVCDPRLQATAEAHLHAALDHLQDDYMGSHWLATFALLAQQAQRSLVSRSLSM
ncbi:DUF2891 domain-containing protein [Halopseudomonas pachastrellae]|jgi:hypothetical protein|nr:DUF2891 domain-containing protein [Halopseudomonas pachastrellae]WVM91930.1 DUF2891 domain-containing protein [Halopseudomonas pachastrellae]|tara:strand:+ start:352 stop:1359 length:1008 start_codon:yes stop_codon:yes gene_type:complete